MYLDDLPDLSRARRMRTASRGVVVRDVDRAAAIAFVADGTLTTSDTIVRFELTRGEDAGRRLTDAFAATGARQLWFYGGDQITRTAVLALEMPLRPVGCVFTDAFAIAPTVATTFRAPQGRERVTLDDVVRDHAPAMRSPLVEMVDIGREPVATVMSEALDDHWTELTAIVHASARGRGLGAVVLAAAAARVTAAGRRACIGIETLGGRERRTIENAGFRLADYYFSATRR